MSQHPDDQRIIAGFLRGEPASVARLDRWIAAAARPYRSRIGSHAEDIRQEVFAELTRIFGQNRFRGESALVSYVWRMTNHACIRQLRLNARFAPGAEELLNARASDQASAAELLIARDRMAALRAIVHRLPEECRDLWRRVLARQSYDAMSAELGIAAGTLRVRVLRCRQRAIALRDERETR